MDGSLISVVIPAWNALRWLPETLDSVMTQHGADFEIVLVDDGSTDGTADYVTQTWPQVRLLRTENRGVSHARNLGTAQARGALVKYLDADDVLLPGTLARQAALMAAHSQADVVYGDWQRLDERPDGSFAPGETVHRSIEQVHEDPEIAFFTHFWCPTGAYLYRRVFLEKVLPWKEWLPVIQDARFAWDAAAAGARWVHDEQVAVLYRQHRHGSVSTRSRLAFLRDCLANTQSIEEHWRLKSNAQQLAARRQWIIQGLGNLCRQAAGLDDRLFEQCSRLLQQLCPAYLPTSPPWLAACSRVTGFRTAARLAGLADRLRARIRIDLQAGAWDKR
jgi:glycosyltransferase involved in cell wall biosynthesis